MTSAQAVAGEVRAALARQRFSGRQAALRLGWTPPYLSRRLIGEIPFDVADLQAIADLLELPITVFFEQPPAAMAGPGGGSRNQHLCRHALELAA
jgi:transcriptional regulator with XRE-family HTH domain